MSLCSFYKVINNCEHLRCIFYPTFNFKTSEYKHVLTKIDEFSIAEPHPLLITLTGLPTLCVLVRPYILPGFA